MCKAKGSNIVPVACAAVPGPERILEVIKEVPVEKVVIKEVPVYVDRVVECDRVVTTIKVCHAYLFRCYRSCPRTCALARALLVLQRTGVHGLHVSMLCLRSMIWRRRCLWIEL